MEPQSQCGISISKQAHNHLFLRSTWRERQNSSHMVTGHQRNHHQPPSIATSPQSNRIWLLRIPILGTNDDLPPNPLDETNARKIGNHISTFIILDNTVPLHRIRKFLRIRIMVDTHQALKMSCNMTREVEPPYVSDTGTRGSQTSITIAASWTTLIARV